MQDSISKIALGLALAVVATTMASARSPHHHHRAPAYSYAPGYYYGGNAPGQIIRDAAARAQLEPGLTSELAPDAQQTATGGPSGGVPGFSGGM